MMTDEKPRRKKRLVLCMGAYCNRGGQAEPLYEMLRKALGEIGPAWTSKSPVRWEIANCLSMCGAGPNMIVYPEDIAYNHLDEKQLAEILNALLKEAEEPSK